VIAHQYSDHKKVVVMMMMMIGEEDGNRRRGLRRVGKEDMV